MEGIQRCFDEILSLFDFETSNTRVECLHVVLQSNGVKSPRRILGADGERIDGNCYYHAVWKCWMLCVGGVDRIDCVVGGEDDLMGVGGGKIGGVDCENIAANMMYLGYFAVVRGIHID